MSEANQSKLLFCLLNNTVSGGNRILFELANRSLHAGLDTDLYFLDKSGQPLWFQNNCPVVQDSMTEVSIAEYDFVFVSNASAVPMLLPYCNINKLVLISQGFESYCYGETITELLSAKEPLENILKLGNPIIATSKSIQLLLQEKVGRTSYLVPVAIDRTQFPRSETVDLTTSPKRILAVGDYKAKFKGILDLADALDILAKELPVQLVLLTQQKSRADWFKHYHFPIEFNCNPPQTDLARIYSSCHVYCCSSWYEGFGLPCLEAFSVGIPVVSTKNFGVNEFTKAGDNMLLARPHSPDDLAAKLRTLLTDKGLRSKLIANGTIVADQYCWQQTMSCFFAALKQIKESKPETVAPDPTEIEALLNNLEENGYYTPPRIEQELTWISAELQALCVRVKDGSIDELESTQILKQLRQHLKRHLHNPATSYYKEFKARFDLCQLFSVIEDPKDWQKLLNFGDV
ncbi:MAG: glycosyltransferase family 4 protein [Candidatus Melainabacteria bacterium]|nr:glycosyltransferase family 4 protein [Candidatus Melainabacteria bacterium]